MANSVYENRIKLENIDFNRANKDQRNNKIMCCVLLIFAILAIVGGISFFCVGLAYHIKTILLITLPAALVVGGVLMGWVGFYMVPRIKYNDEAVARQILSHLANSTLSEAAALFKDQTSALARYVFLPKGKLTENSVTYMSVKDQMDNLFAQIQATYQLPITREGDIRNMHTLTDNLQREWESLQNRHFRVQASV